MQPNAQPYYDPRDTSSYLPPLRYTTGSTGFATYSGQTSLSWTLPQAAHPAPPPQQPFAHPYAPYYLPNQLHPLQQPSPALSLSPQLAQPFPSRSSSATSTASQGRTNSTNASQHSAREDFTRADSPLTDSQVRAQRYWGPKLDSMSTSDYAYRVQAEHDLASMTVDKLKLAIRSANSRLSLHLRVSGKKHDLYSALVDQLATEYNRVDKSRFQILRAVISSAKIGSSYTGYSPAARSGYDAYPNYGASTSTGAGASGYSGYGASTNGAGASGYGATGAAAAARVGTGASTSAATNNLPPPRFGGAGAYGTGAASAAAVGAAMGAYARAVDDIPIRFRPSPFFRIEKSVSPVVALHKAAQGDRKTAVCTITLSEAQRTLLAKSKESPANPQYQLRLYCTSDTNYNQLRAQANQFPAPVEFPGTCEVKLNGVTLSANTKGIKKQPGTAPPVNLTPKSGPAVVLTPGATNRAEVIYINTDKTFYLVTYLVEYTSVDKVVTRVKAGKTKPKEEVIKSIIALNSDEDVEASALGLSLRDPLSFLRIDVPIRSAHCEHIACFDAMTWFEVNEQTPQWQCPICSKTLKVDDMVVDGYLEDILKVCSSSVESVTVEPDGTWRSDNNKFGTAKPRSTLPSSAASGRNTPVGAGGSEAPSAAGASDGVNGNGNGKGKQRASDELVLSDDDDDSDGDLPLAKRRRLDSSVAGGGSSAGTPGVGTPLGAAAGGGAGARRREVVDLTLSSDEEDDADDVEPPPRASTTSTAAGATPGAGAGTGARGAPALERQPSDRKTAAEVEMDLKRMTEKMVRDYGPNWKEQFGYH